MDGGATLVADLKPAEAVEPRERALHPPAVPSEPPARFDAASGDARRGAASSRRPPTARIVVTLSACRFTGRLRGRPRRWRGGRNGGSASTVSSGLRASCALEPEIVTASGVPWRSTTRWRLVPGLPRSVGSLPVASPPREPARSRRRGRPAPSRYTRRPRGAGGACGAAVSTPPPAASRAGVASTSSRCRRPSLAGASPRGGRS
jgi:hypothetical protein